MSFQDIVAGAQRILILQALAQDSDYSHNEYVLKAFLRTRGEKIGTDKLRTELSWLKEQGLVRLDTTPGAWVVMLTSRGKDVADGAVTVPGVEQPEPEI